MNKKIIIPTLVVATLLGTGLTALVIYNDKQTSSPPTDQNNTKDEGQSSSNGSLITVVGKMTCLLPKDTSGPSNTICAIGLEGDDGKSYALTADDPTMTGSVPTGQRVKVTGSFTPQTTQYDSVGLIKVETLQQQ